MPLVAVPPEDYYAELAAADLVVLPYDAEVYRDRSSGILAEALAAGKPVVVPAHTWMADQIDDRRGRVFHGADELPAAAGEILQRYPAFARAAADYVSRWREQHSPLRLLEVLEQPHRETAAAASP